MFPPDPPDSELFWFLLREEPEDLRSSLFIYKLIKPLNLQTAQQQKFSGQTEISSLSQKVPVRSYRLTGPHEDRRTSPHTQRQLADITTGATTRYNSG